MKSEERYPIVRFHVSSQFRSQLRNQASLPLRMLQIRLPPAQPVNTPSPRAPFIAMSGPTNTAQPALFNSPPKPPCPIHRGFIAMSGSTDTAQPAPFQPTTQTPVPHSSRLHRDEWVHRHRPTSRVPQV